MSTANILVVDDDPDMCQLLWTILGKNDFHVEIAYDGVEGLEKVDVSEPDLVVLDIMMPGMDGWETCRRMKAVADVPILFLSARKDVQSVAQGFEVGGYDYISKPFQFKDLTTRIEKLLLIQSNPLLETIPPTAIDPKLMPIMTPAQSNQRLYFFIKRLLDFFIAGILLIVLSPLMFLISLLIKFDSKGPIIFKQERIRPRPHDNGTEEPPAIETFTFLKFRTMYQNVTSDPHRAFLQALIQNDHKRMTETQCNDTRTRKLTDDQRVTRLGRFLRKSSMDELPQLWNVFKGDMCLVGPRPPIPYEVEMYEPWHRRRLTVKPGLTGLWQVAARSSAGFDEMVRMDIWYIDHQSFWLDLKILLKTPLAALSMEGAV